MHTLELDCHVRPGADAVILVTIGQTNYQFDLTPTINWVASSSQVGAHKISMDIDIPTTVSNTTHDIAVQIEAQGSDALICGYSMSRGIFQISSQPVWNVPGWQPYDITGHQGHNAQYQGPGSLQILAGQTVKFMGTVIIPAVT